ncbi:energy transducer TonB [Chromobacterium haemolyticum]|uniref:energy transducer TonB n=1 Tax=Chromobacterium haemolyticum TaxID=394935 RepID=UPI0009D9E7ED|nr:energy transducer TonB [Chromobacterium haemolyticum]OQS37260.1 hypothetical protein B0T39_15730 [Chromobacterium haemolyticum]
MGARPVCWALLASLALHALLLFAWQGRPPPPSVAALTLRLAQPAGGPSPAIAQKAAKAGNKAGDKLDNKAAARPSAKPSVRFTAPSLLPEAGLAAPAAAAVESAGVEGAKSGAGARSGGGSASQGGADSVALYRAEYLNNPQPEYPERSRENGEQGTVLLRVGVSAAGRAGEVTVAVSSGYPRLDRAAKAAVERWRFAPAKRNGQAVDSVLIVPVRFQSH